MQKRVIISKLTRRRMPGMVSTWDGENPLETKIRCNTMAETTAVIMHVPIRNASLYLSAVVAWNSNMKL
ncbi:hypothetical protein HanIR_Chr02g0099581 [Helianthus annuus]|nr:hypothetical protein HanIR_Chr02g0099581 [Helianthus annuus]